MSARVEPLDAVSFDELRSQVLQPAAEAPPKVSVEDLLLHDFKVIDRTVSPPREGVFTSEVPTTSTRINLARSHGVLANGVPWESFPREDQELMDSIALCTWCLKAKPDWFEDPMGGRCPIVILRVGEEIRAHIARFFRAVADAGEISEERPLVEVAALVGGQIRPAVDP